MPQPKEQRVDEPPADTPITQLLGLIKKNKRISKQLGEHIEGLTSKKPTKRRTDDLIERIRVTLKDINENFGTEFTLNDFAPKEKEKLQLIWGKKPYAWMLKSLRQKPQPKAKKPIMVEQAQDEEQPKPRRKRKTMLERLAEDVPTLAENVTEEERGQVERYLLNVVLQYKEEDRILLVNPSGQAGDKSHLRSLFPDPLKFTEKGEINDIRKRLSTNEIEELLHKAIADSMDKSALTETQKRLAAIPQTKGLLLARHAEIVRWVKKERSKFDKTDGYTGLDAQEKTNKFYAMEREGKDIMMQLKKIGTTRFDDKHYFYDKDHPFHSPERPSIEELINRGESDVMENFKENVLGDEVIRKLFPKLEEELRAMSNDEASNYMFGVGNVKRNAQQVRKLLDVSTAQVSPAEIQHAYMTVLWEYVNSGHHFYQRLDSDKRGELRHEFNKTLGIIRDENQGRSSAESTPDQSLAQESPESSPDPSPAPIPQSPDFENLPMPSSPVRLQEAEPQRLVLKSPESPKQKKVPKPVPPKQRSREELEADIQQMRGREKEFRGRDVKQQERIKYFQDEHEEHTRELQRQQKKTRQHTEDERAMQLHYENTLKKQKQYYEDIQKVHPPVVVQPPDDQKEDARDIRKREAWVFYKRRYPFAKLSHFKYNDYIEMWEPRLERITRRKRNKWGAFETVSQALPHPISRHIEDTQLERLDKQQPLGRFPGTKVSLGTHISLKLQPAVVYCHITKGVQKAALQILAHRIVEHALGTDTRILMQHGPSGKYKYYLWLSTKEMKELDVENFLERLVRITKQRTRAVTIIVKQSIVHGTIHEVFSRKFSLL